MSLFYSKPSDGLRIVVSAMPTEEPACPDPCSTSDLTILSPLPPCSSHSSFGADPGALRAECLLAYHFLCRKCSSPSLPPFLPFSALMSMATLLTAPAPLLPSLFVPLPRIVLFHSIYHHLTGFILQNYFWMWPCTYCHIPSTYAPKSQELYVPHSWSQFPCLASR